MKNDIRTLLGLKKTEGRYGVEIEAEGNILPNDISAVWRVERDNSLQSGYEAREYVMKAPSDLNGVRQALNDLAKAYKYNGTQVYETDTSGVHVHLNVQEYTLKELFTLYTTYFAVEELLLTYCGEQRQGNHFCLRMKDAEYILQEYIMTATKRNLINLKTENLRYCSLNSLSLFNYGSAEFRAMRGTPDLDAIFEWVTILDRIRQAALEFPDPSEVVRVMSMGGEIEFIKRVFGDKANIFLAVKGCTNMVRDGVRMIQALAYCTDWSKYKAVSYTHLTLPTNREV